MRNATRRVVSALAASVVAGTALIGLLAGGAAADVGVGITARTITLPHPVPAGRTAKATGVYVVNTGSDTGAVHLRVADLEHTRHHPIPSSWVTFTPSTVTLGPKKGTVVPFTVTVPHGAALGAYQSDLVATGTSAGAKAGNGTQVGAAAATRFTFAVVASKSSSGLHLPSWVWIAVAATVAAALLFLLIRASGLRLHVERSRPNDD